MGFADSLRENYYKHFSLPPTMPWRDSIPPNAPVSLSSIVEKSNIHLNWQTPPMARDNEPVYGYVIYRFDTDEATDISNPKNIIHIQYNTDTNFVDESAQPGKSYLYLVTALDRLKNESEPSVTILATMPAILAVHN